MANFGLSTTKVSASNILKPWGIYDVVLKDVILKTGTSKEGRNWQALQFKFVGEKGSFEPMFFCPETDGDKRHEGETNGRSWVLPSAFEQLGNTIAHVVGTLNPAGYEKLRGISLDLPTDFAKLVDYVKRSVAPAFNKATQIKVIGNNKNYAQVPSFVSINKDGEAYISNNWVGANLAFTPGEVKKMNEIKNATPTTPKEDTKSASVDTDVDNDGLDFDI